MKNIEFIVWVMIGVCSSAFSLITGIIGVYFIFTKQRLNQSKNKKYKISEQKEIN